MEIVTISLGRGKFAKVDFSDWLELKQFNWFMTTNGYAARWRPRNGGPKRMELMHRRILLANSEQEVDHIDGDKLNNTRANIRIATRGQNQQRAPYKTSSGYRGVKKHRNRWLARINISKKEIHLGSFVNKEDAAKAYNEAALRHYGPLAFVNRLVDK